MCKVNLQHDSKERVPSQEATRAVPIGLQRRQQQRGRCNAHEGVPYKNTLPKQASLASAFAQRNAIKVACEQQHISAGAKTLGRGQISADPERSAATV
jgi:hypothetical protein